ncbi:hypothetical protein KIS4809_1513 [Bacillus sp. ZZV12-4809]|nr:hypothetical protein KIS4809_1513 [Bacillus sp. ZZV12-4809]
MSLLGFACGVSHFPLLPQDIELASPNEHRTKEMRQHFRGVSSFRSNQLSKLNQLFKKQQTLQSSHYIDILFPKRFGFSVKKFTKTFRIYT